MSDAGERLRGLPIAEFAFPGPQRDRLVRAILEGRKTATTGLHEEYLRRGESLPAGRPVAVLETSEVRVIPLGDVDLSFALAEGEGFASVADWRASHERFFESPEMLSALGEPVVPIHDGTLVVCERFHVVERLTP